MKILIERAVIAQVLEALEKYADWRCTPETDQIITALREALAEQAEPTDKTKMLNHIWETLYDHGNGKYRGDVSKAQRELAMQYVEELKAEQAEQEPVAWHEPRAYSNVTVYKNWANENGWIPLYAAPVRTKDLTDDEIYSVVANLGFAQLSPIEVARAVIAKFKEKNK